MPLVSFRTCGEVEMKTGFHRFVRALMLGAPKKW
jgi:hypothetical protein